MNSRYIKIGEAAKLLGVSNQTMLRWHKSGQMIPDMISDGGTRFYLKSTILGESNKSDKTIAYARVSSRTQSSDLETQVQALQMFCTSNGWSYEIIKDFGSGINYKKHGLKKLITLINNQEISRIVITNRDRLVRFGNEIIEQLCELNDVEIIIINETENDKSFEQELVDDVLQIITVFSAKLYGRRSRKNKKIIETVTQQMKGADDYE